MSFADPSQLPLCPGLADPFLRADGSRIQHRNDWPEQRNYLKSMLSHYMYGQSPPAPDELQYTQIKEQLLLDGAATCRWYNITFERNGLSCPLRFNIISPNNETKHPVIIKNDPYLYLLENYELEKYHGTDLIRIQDDEAEIQDAINRGYALCKFVRTDLALDQRQARDQGIYPLYPEYNWGVIAVWAWAYHSIIDVLLEECSIDQEKIIATGHSRGGKTALCAGIFEERISMVVPNSSGLGGTASMRYFDDNAGEPQTIISHQGSRDHWWCDNYMDIGKHIDRLPFDAHCLKALIAPRFLLNPHARQDFHANPYGTELTHLVAKDIFTWLGCEDHIALHWRDGGHAQNHEDWQALLDFADLHFYGKTPASNFNQRYYNDIEIEKNWDIPDL